MGDSLNLIKNICFQLYDSESIRGIGWCTSLHVDLKTNLWTRAPYQTNGQIKIFWNHCDTKKAQFIFKMKKIAPELCLPYCSSTVKENFQQKVSRIVLLCQAHCYSSSSSEILYNFSILLMTVPSTSSKSLASELPNSIFVTQGRGKSKFLPIPRSITVSMFEGYWETC